MFPRLEIDIGWRDLAAALVWRGAEAPDLQAFTQPRCVLVPALSVRSAFDALLSALDLPPGSEVLISAVNIEGMAAIAERHRLRLRPLDLDLATLSPDPVALAEALDGGPRLVLFAHLYGARADLTDLAYQCQRRGVPLIEDCAQAFSGRLEPPAGDVALYSFGPIKPSTALGGAVAVFRDPVLAEAVHAGLEAHPPLPDRWFRRRLLKYALLKALSHPWPYGLVLRLIHALGRDPEAVIGGLARGFKGGDLLVQARRRPPPRLLALLHRRLLQADAATSRRARARRMAEAPGPHLVVPGARAPSHQWWVLPVLAEDPERLVAALRRAGFDATRGATSLRVIGPAGLAPEAERLLSQVVYLPNSARCAGPDVRRLIERIRAGA